MGYRSNNRNNQLRPRPPKGPVKLAFGVVKVVDADAPKPLPVPPRPPEPMPRQDIVGVLTLKSIRIDDVKPVPEAHLLRIIANLERMYKEGIYLNSKSIMDYKDGELLVTFSYDQGAVDRIKGLDRSERAWDPDQKVWRIFPGTFDDVIDILGRGTKLTEAAFEALSVFVRSNYYAHLARGKLGKLIVRESWFEELDMLRDMPDLQTAHGSSAQTNGKSETLPVTPELEKIRERIAKFDFKRKPYEHQISGIEYLLSNNDCALLDEMGCGKSFQIASAVAMMLNNREVDRVLIVAPMSLVKTWQTELALATDEPFTVISGTPAQRTKAFTSRARIFVIHYEGLRLEEIRLADWLKLGRAVMVLDESQRIKNLVALTTMAAIKLRPFVDRCIIATGTPIANRPLDLFSQYLVMDKGRTFGTRYPAFKNTFCELEVQKIQVGRKTIRVERFLGVRNGDELHNRILRTSLRRLKSEVLDLPPVIFKDFVVELKNEQRTMYLQMRDTLKVQISQMSAADVISEASTIMVQLLRLSQIASNPGLLDPNYKGSNAKLSELEDLLEDVFSDDTKKVILWSHYVQNVKFMTEHFGEKYKAVAHTGEMNVEDRQRSVEAFQDDPTTRLFIATPQSAKEGLTLLPKDGVMKADTMIYLDLSFDSGSYVQSQARFHRIGQTAERCLVIHLIGDSTIDEYIRKAVIEKIRTATQLLDDGDKTNPDLIKSGSRLAKDELLGLL